MYDLEALATYKSLASDMDIMICKVWIDVVVVETGGIQFVA